MSMSDPITDILNRFRNAMMAGRPTAECPASSIKEKICAVLKSEGFIHDYELVGEGPGRFLRLRIKYLPDRKPVVQGIRRISKPSLRVYRRSSELRPVRSGLGISIVSTSRGVMTGKQARAANVGGEVLCEIW